MIGGEYTFNDLVNGNTTPVECSHIVTGIFRGVSTIGTYKEVKTLTEMRLDIDLNIRVKHSQGPMSVEVNAGFKYDE